MSRIRFATARALYESFPKSVTGISAEPSEDPPIEFVKKLEKQEKFIDAVTFCAYLLPRREAVWWACRCAKSLLGEIPKSEAEGLLAAEAWVYEPAEERRHAALKIGVEGDSNDPMTWLALGAGWSGGMLNPNPKMPIPMPQYMTARAARMAVVLCTLKVPPPKRHDQQQACITEGLRIADQGI
jgi:hypothetical protein